MNSLSAVPAPEKVKAIATGSDGGVAPINSSVTDELQAEVVQGTQEENRAVDRRIPRDFGREGGDSQVRRQTGNAGEKSKGGNLWVLRRLAWRDWRGGFLKVQRRS